MFNKLKKNIVYAYKDRLKKNILYAFMNWLKKKNILLRLLIKFPYSILVFVMLYFFKGDILFYLETFIKDDNLVIKYLILQFIIHIFKTIILLYIRLRLFLTKNKYNWHRRIKLDKIFNIVKDVKEGKLQVFIHNIPYFMLVSFNIKYFKDAILFVMGLLGNDSNLIFLFILFIVSQLFKEIFKIYYDLYTSYIYKYIKNKYGHIWFIFKARYTYNKHLKIIRFKRLILKRKKK